MHRQKHSVGLFLVILATVGVVSIGLMGCDDNGGIQNQPPVFTQLADQSVTEGQSLTFQIIADDPDNDAIGLGVQNQPANSRFVDNGDGTGDFTFSPNFAQKGSYQPVFVASDGNMQTMDTVSIEVVDESFIHHSGIISADETWSAGDSPHLVAGDIEVQDGAMLTIENITVYFVAGKRLRVGYNGPGGLQASNVTFTPVNENPTPGAWDGISFAAQTLSASSLDNCVIEYGGGNSFGNIFVSDGAVSITDCTIRHSETDGVHFVGEGHAVDFSGNVIESNSRYPATIPANYLGGLKGSSLLGNSRDTILIVGDHVSQDSEWDTLGVPLRISRRFEVRDEATLSIVPGLVLTFDGGTGIDVGLTSPGHLQANGTSDKPIRLLPNVGSPTPGDWEGLTFGPFAGPTNALDYCEISYAAESNDAAVIVVDSEVSITNSTISFSNLYGVQFQGAGHFSTFSGNTVSDCGSFPVIIPCHFAGNFTGDNTYTDNGSQYIGLTAGTVTDMQTWLNLSVPYMIRGDVAVDNNGQLTIAGGATLLFLESFGITVGQNEPATLIADGTESLITFTTSSEPTTWVGIQFMSNTTDNSLLDNCLIDYAGNSNSAAIVLEDCQVNIHQNTIQNGAGDGVRFVGTAYALDFEDNVITDNGGAPITVDANSVGLIPPNNDYSGNETDAFRIGGSQLTSDATWANPGIPFIVENMISIEPGVTLTLNPGLALRFGLTAGFTVQQNAAIVADGSQETISFTPDSRDWPGLVFLTNASESSLLKSCRIEDAGKYDEINLTRSEYPGSVYLQNCHITIADCDILGSGEYGIFLQGSAYVDGFSGNTIQGEGPPVRTDASTVQRLTPGNTLSSDDEDLVVVEIGGDATIEDDAERIGRVRSDAAWSDIGIPYYIVDSIWVGSGATLTLNPGIEIQVQTRRSITVGGHIGEGTLVAIGTPDQQIEITPAGFPWGALTLVGSANDNSTLEYCYLNDGGRNRCGMLKIVDCSPTVQNNDFGQTHTNSCKICLSGETTLDPETLRNENTFSSDDDGADVCSQ